MTSIGIPREVHAGERRVAATPETAARLQKLGYTVLLETGAGAAAQFSDEAYAAAGVDIIPETRALYEKADIILKVRAPESHPELGLHESELLRAGTILASFIWPAQNPELLEKLKERQVTALAMDAVPRISRAQKLDALSSMANIAGYRAIIEAAQHFGRFFTGQITAAGKVPPAKVMVIGAGVAGLA
ncbi:MAG: NAD(P)(+) transhydrogenase (Re/Si-specific) subunit alpha, partial [Candidatus Competibacteraceae bacterium]|nr:NAD(P)(+) transhydrogenase (Re/Si-specific) subunit alpha [Candidatus Competibacteraceae bacterium]